MTDAAALHHPWHYDAAALTAIVGSFAGLLPSIAAGIGAVWYMILIYDWISGRIARRRGKRRSRLRRARAEAPGAETSADAG